MSVVEIQNDLKRLSCLLASLNKLGLDTKLIELGQQLTPKLGDDETILVENDTEQVNVLYKNYQEGKTKPNQSQAIQLKDKKPVRGYIDGCYDLIHAGHYNSFRQASKLGDQLVCGVNSDAEVTLVKGPPVFNNEERCIIVRACKWVDEVATDTEYTPTEETLNRYDCDFYAHGDDIALNADGTDSAYDLKCKGKFKMFKRTRGVSTTDIAKKLLKIQSSSSDDTDLEGIEEEKDSDESTTSDEKEFPSTLGSFNANPMFLASAKRIAQFASIREPMESDKIVYVDGGWDVCHPGHIELLKKAKELGDYLIVGVHEDECVRQYLGKDYPLNTLHERVLNLLACKYVDDVIIGAPFKLTERLIRDLNVSVVVKSLDVIQGHVKSKALSLKPYEIPEKKELLAEVDIECTLTIKEIAARVQQNKEAIEKKCKISAVKQEQFE